MHTKHWIVRSHHCAFFLLSMLLFCTQKPAAQAPTSRPAFYAVTTTNVDSGWANNSINTVIFRKNSLVTSGTTQYIAYYNASGFVVVGKRKLGSETWQLQQTQYKGDISDAHRTISIMADGQGYLHMAWDHHNNPLNYCRSKQPGSLEMGSKMPMTGKAENSLSYPEFYKLPSGDLLFFYRDGASGKGNLVIDKWIAASRKWIQLSDNLIDGEGQRSAYWQACIDSRGTIHISWVWRESPDVASNHDLCYARSLDGGKTWQKSTGEKYVLPIRAGTAENAAAIPQKSELINQTSMYADAEGHPYIATYWREAGSKVPQYHLVFNIGHQWQTHNLSFRKTAFTLSGGGTKRIPISRPQIIAWKSGKSLSAALIYRDEERDNHISMALNPDLQKPDWQLYDVTTFPLGSWEPTYDTELWKSRGVLDLFVQKVEQVDGEGRANVPPSMIQVVEWKPKIN